MTRLLGWKDCTPMTANSATDSFGHGTFMTKLLMRVAPSVDVYLIRVASNTEELENSEKSIAEVCTAFLFFHSRLTQARQSNMRHFIRTGEST